MTLKFIRFVFIICLWATHASSEIVNNIIISGNKRISSETIKVLGNISTKINLEKRFK